MKKRRRRFLNLFAKKENRWTPKMTSLLTEFLIILASFPVWRAGCLQLENLKVPPVVVEGQIAVLSCPFALQTDTLYSVLWYKDHEEFYRFVPKNSPKQHSYQLEGFTVDMAMSNDQQVFLRNMTLKATGTYRCEVSAEAPSFSSTHDEAQLEVIVLPAEDPKIYGQQAVYSIGDVMILNCTSGKSYPPANLEWFINDSKVLSDFDYFEEEFGLVSSTSSLRLLLEHRHFQNGRLIVRCVATVGPMRSFARIAPLLLNHKETSLLVQARGSTAPNLFFGFKSFLFNIMTVYLLVDP